MASFVDQPYQFNEFVQTTPIESMVKVGMHKQERYDQNVQRIQATMDAQAALPVMRDVDKSYLQSMLNSLHGELKKVGAADFSQQQLMDSVGGMADQISKDQNILSAVQSTENHRIQQQRMEDARQKGTLTPENEYSYSKQIAGYLSSDELGETFNGSYTDFFDWNKHARDVINEIKPDGFTAEELYETDSQGRLRLDKNGSPIASPVLRRLEIEGRAPEKVREALKAVFADPRVARQLQISGEYALRGDSPLALAERIDKQKESLLGNVNEEIADLTAKMNASSDQKAKDAYNLQIESLTRGSENIKDSYSSLKNAAINNPDAIRGHLYAEDMLNKYTSSLSYQNKKETSHTNPLWQANFDMMKEANANSRWAQGFAFDKEKFQNEQAWKQLDYQQKWEIEVLKASKAGKKGKEELVKSPELGNMSSDFDPLFVADQAYKSAATSFTASADDFIYQMGFNSPNNEAEIGRMMSNSGISREEAMSKILAKAAKQNGEKIEDFRTRWSIKAQNIANTNPVSDKRIITSQHNFIKAKKDFETQQVIKQNIDTDLKAQQTIDVDKEIGALNLKPQIIKMNGQDYKLSEADIVDMATYLKGNESILGFTVDENVRKSGKNAEARLRQRGLGVLVEDVMKQKGPWLSGGPVTALGRMIGNIPSNFTETINFTNSLPVGSDYAQIMKAFDVLGKEGVSKNMKTKADIVRKHLFVEPNLSQSLLTGNAEDDRATAQELGRMATNYQTVGNMSPDFKQFKTEIGKLQKEGSGYTLGSNIYKDPSGKSAVEVVLSSEGKRVGGMVLQADEAINFGIDVEGMMVPKEVTQLKNLINFKKNKSTANGSVTNPTTYTSGDYYFDNNDFPMIKNSNFDVKANVAEQGGVYYPYIYVRDKTTGNNKVISLSGDKDLNSLLNLMKTTVTPSAIQVELNKK